MQRGAARCHRRRRALASRITLQQKRNLKFPKKSASAIHSVTRQKCNARERREKRAEFTVDAAQMAARRRRRARASLRSADAAQVRNNVGLVPIDGPFERSVAKPAGQRVRERLRRARGAAAHVSRGDICSAIDEQTAGLEVTITRRPMQRGVITARRWFMS